MSSSYTKITSNPLSDYLFSVSMDTAKKRVKIQAKHKNNAHKQYSSEFTENDLKSLNFYHSIKGFFNRLKMAIESKSPQELRAYYIVQTNALTLTLEEKSKFDDETTKWKLSLKQQQRKISSKKRYVYIATFVPVLYKLFWFCS